MSKANAQLDPSRVAEIAEYLRKGRTGDVALKDVMVLAELMVGSMQSFFEALDSTVYTELREIADYISNAKEEIRNLQANDIKNNRIPEAGKVLDEIVKSTEDATHTIMEQAELLMAADTEDAKAYQAQVNDAVMQIFEACSFQDLTGQRISKIVETLNFIDHRIGRLAEVIGGGDAEVHLTELEAAREERKKKNILHGPQSAEDAISQSDVDSVLDGSAGSDDGEVDETSQDDIDALFD